MNSTIKKQIKMKLLNVNSEDFQTAIDLIDAHLKEVGGGMLPGFNSFAPIEHDQHDHEQ